MANGVSKTEIKVPIEIIANFGAMAQEMEKMAEAILLSNNPKFVDKVKKAEKEIAEGKLTKYEDFLKEIK